MDLSLLEALFNLIQGWYGQLGLQTTGMNLMALSVVVHSIPPFIPGGGNINGHHAY